MNGQQRFDPPAKLADFSPAQRGSWHEFISSSIAHSIGTIQLTVGKKGVPQFYDPAHYRPKGPTIEQSIVWNAFPKELLRKYGRADALRRADTPLNLADFRESGSGNRAAGKLEYRPQTEYCEWHVVRDPVSHKIQRVSFTSEPPEYWSALAGGSLRVIDGQGSYAQTVRFAGNRKKLLALYRQYVSPRVQLRDLFATQTIKGSFETVSAGDYNPFNVWNTTHGAMHLSAPPNTIAQEIALAADSTVSYVNGNLKPVVDPQQLICCASFGNPDRNSDPTIMASVNALARLGSRLTLTNPVGLYMDDIDTSGWEAPDGKPISPFFKIARGRPGMIARLVCEVPPHRKFCLGDVTIGGEPIEYGGQIAECITVKLVASATIDPADRVVPPNPAKVCISQCCIDPINATTIDLVTAFGKAAPPGAVVAFAADQGAARSQHPRVHRMKVAGRVPGRR